MHSLEDDIRHGLVVIPPQPAILHELHELVSDPDYSLGDVGKLIAKDVGLAAVILRLANSPAFSFRARVDNIQRAVTTIGVSHLTNIVKAFELRKAIGGDEAAMARFWDRSTEVARIAAVIAGKQVAVCNISVDQAYLAGLFHDCGVALLMQRFPDYGKAMHLDDASVWVDLTLEDQRYQTEHAVVGYLVAKHWHLPTFICDAIRFHHDMLQVEHASRTMVCLLQLARHIYSVSMRQEDIEWYRVKDQVLDECGLDDAGLREFEEDVLERFRQEDH